MIIEGSYAGQNFQDTAVLTPKTLFKVGLALFVIAFAILNLTTVILFKSAQHSHGGKKMVLLAVTLPLRFSFIRIVYFAFAVFANSSRFRYITGDVTVLLCMALSQEVFVGRVGLTLQK